MAALSATGSAVPLLAATTTTGAELNKRRVNVAVSASDAVASSTETAGEGGWVRAAGRPPAAVLRAPAWYADPACEGAPLQAAAAVATADSSTARDPAL